MTLAGMSCFGRGDTAEIRLNDPFASSRHARVYEQGKILVIEDLGSTNGTYLNEELLDGPRPLHPGDRVRIGDSEFSLRGGLTSDDAACGRALVRHGHRPAKTRQRGLDARALAAVRGRRRHGGAQAGEVASQRRGRHLPGGLSDGSDPESSLVAQVEQANSHINELSHGNIEHAGMGTTITAVYVGEHDVAVAHVGDSRPTVCGRASCCASPTTTRLWTS